MKKRNYQRGNRDIKKQNILQYAFIFNGYPEGLPLASEQTGRKVKIENSLLCAGIALEDCYKKIR